MAKVLQVFEFFLARKTQEKKKNELRPSENVWKRCVLQRTEPTRMGFWPVERAAGVSIARLVSLSRFIIFLLVLWRFFFLFLAHFVCLFCLCVSAFCAFSFFLLVDYCESFAALAAISCSPVTAQIGFLIKRNSNWSPYAVPGHLPALCTARALCLSCSWNVENCTGNDWCAQDFPLSLSLFLSLHSSFCLPAAKPHGQQQQRWGTTWERNNNKISLLWHVAASALRKWMKSQRGTNNFLYNIHICIKCI